MKEKLRLLPLILLAVCLTLGLALTSCDTGSSGTGDDPGELGDNNGGGKKPSTGLAEAVPIRSQQDLKAAIRDSSVEHINILIEEFPMTPVDGDTRLVLDFDDRDPGAKLTIELTGKDTVLSSNGRPTAADGFICEEIPANVTLRVNHGFETVFAVAAVKMANDLKPIKGTLILGEWYDGSTAGGNPFASFPAIEGALILEDHAQLDITGGNAGAAYLDDLVVNNGGTVTLSGASSALRILSGDLLAYGANSAITISGNSATLTQTPTANATPNVSSIKGKLTLSGLDTSLVISPRAAANGSGIFAVEKDAVLSTTGIGALVDIRASSVAGPPAVNTRATLRIESGGTVDIGRGGTLRIRGVNGMGSGLTTGSTGTVKIADGAILHVTDAGTTAPLLTHAGTIDLKGTLREGAVAAIWGNAGTSSGKVTVYSSTKYDQPDRFDGFALSGEASIDWYREAAFAAANNQARVYEFKKGSGAIRGSLRQRQLTTVYSSDYPVADLATAPVDSDGNQDTDVLGQIVGTGFWKAAPAAPYDANTDPREFLFKGWYGTTAITWMAQDVSADNDPPKAGSPDAPPDLYAFPDGRYNGRFGYVKQ